jgi:hypothetical protein
LRLVLALEGEVAVLEALVLGAHINDTIFVGDGVLLDVYF